MTPKYYEAHITVEPFPNERFYEICTQWRFKPAKLLMQRERETTPVRSDKDAFCTAHAKTFEEIAERMTGAVDSMRAYGIQVHRAKIEAVLFDERY